MLTGAAEAYEVLVDMRVEAPARYKLLIAQFHHLCKIWACPHLASQNMQSI